MKWTLVSLAAVGAVVLGVSTAQAADLAPMPMYKAPMLPPPAYSWTGFYVGANGGFGGNKFDYPVTAGPASGTASLNSSGFFGGGQIGYNWQLSPLWVVGLETDFDEADIEGKATASTALGGASAGSKIDWFGTVRGRAGALVTPNTLLYATGGWAYGHTTTSASAALLGVGAATSIGSNQNGWAVGGGLEYAFNSWLSFKTEYLYVDLGTSTLVSGAAGAVPFSLSEKATAHTVKAGINIKLGDLGAGWMR
jgi:outer membrane immunogenic protein